MHAVRTAAGAAGPQALLDGFTRYLRAERGVSALTVDAPATTRSLIPSFGNGVIGSPPKMRAELVSFSQNSGVGRSPSGPTPASNR